MIARSGPAALLLLGPGCVMVRASGGLELPVDDRPVEDDRRPLGGSATASLTSLWWDGAVRVRSGNGATQVALTPSFCLPLPGPGTVVLFTPCAGANLIQVDHLDERTGFSMLSPVLDPRMWIRFGDSSREGAVVVSVPMSYDWRWARGMPESFSIGVQVGIGYVEHIDPLRD